MVLLLRLRGRNDCLLVLPAFGHPSFTDRRKLATFPLVFLVLPDPLERISPPTSSSASLAPFLVRSRSRVWNGGYLSSLGFVRTDIFFESFCASRKNGDSEHHDGKEGGEKTRQGGRRTVKKATRILDDGCEPQLVELFVLPVRMATAIRGARDSRWSG